MKSIARILFMITVMLTFATVAPAQSGGSGSEETVTIPKSQLTDQQKADLTAKELANKQEMFGKWVGIGDEVGKAVNSGLSAVTTQANNFAQTPVGKWTMFVIVFKVIGQKVFGYLVGVALFIIGLPLWFWSYRRFMPRKYISKITYAADGKKQSVEYNYGYGDSTDRSNRLSADDAQMWMAWHWGMLVLLIIISAITMWSGN